MRFAVVIPTHKRYRFLQVALASVQAQTPQDWEGFVVDYEGAPRVENIVERLNDERFRYWRNERQKGPAGARNTAIFNSDADWFAFLDDDDEWLPERLARVSALIEANEDDELALIYTGWYKFDYERGKPLSRHTPTESGSVSLRMPSFNWGATSNMVASRELLLDSPYEFSAAGFDERLGAGEDVDMYLRAATMHHIGIIEEPLLRVRAGGHERITTDKRGRERWTPVHERYWHLMGANRGDH